MEKTCFKIQVMELSYFIQRFVLLEMTRRDTLRGATPQSVETPDMLTGDLVAHATREYLDAIREKQFELWRKPLRCCSLDH